MEKKPEENNFIEGGIIGGRMFFHHSWDTRLRGSILEYLGKKNKKVSAIKKKLLK